MISYVYIKKRLLRMQGARKTVSPPYGCNHTEDFLRILSNLLAANGLSKPFGRGKSTGG